MKTTRTTFLALYTLICMIWGSTWLVIRIGDEAALPPFLGAAARFMLAAAILWIWVFVGKYPLPHSRREVRASVINGVLSAGASYSIVYWCSQFIPSGLESVIFGTMPLWTILFGAFMFRSERMTLNRTLGVGLGLIGILLIFYPEMHGVTVSQLAVLALLLGSPMVSAISLLVTKNDGKRIHPVSLNAIAITIGAIILTLIAAMTTDLSQVHINGTQVWTVGYLAVFGTVISFVVYYKLLRSTAAITMSYVALITPVIAVLLGWLVAGERLDRFAVSGSGLVLAGVWLTLRQPARKAQILRDSAAQDAR